MRCRDMETSAIAGVSKLSASDAPAPRVTVVIAAYNAERFIRQTLDSVFAQTLRDVELIVIDDGSTDGTPTVLRNIDNRRLSVLRQANSGVSAARNAGLALARAPYIFFLDADDVLVPDALRRMVATLDDNPDRVACFAHHIRIAEDGAELTRRTDLPLKMFPAKDTLRNLVTKNFIVCGAICIRTDAARQVRGFNSELKWGEDWEFWCRLAALADFVAMPNDIVLMYRQHGGSANFRWRNSPIRPDYKAIEAVYSHPAIVQRVPAVELKHRKRLAHIDAFWTAARNAYVQGRTIEFLTYLLVGSLRYPDSILRPGLVYLFLRGLRRPKALPAASLNSGRTIG
jgi:glycosyltransferase involved in cell wall biosynthesis